MSFGSFLFGKKKGSSFAPIQRLALDPDLDRTTGEGRGLQSLAAKEAREAYSGDAGTQARREMQQGLAQKQAGFADSRRKLQSLIAQRGLGRSSVGLGQEVGLQRQQQQEIQREMGTLPERIRQLREQRAKSLAGIGGQILGTPGAQRHIREGARGYKTNGIASTLAGLAQFIPKAPPGTGAMASGLVSGIQQNA